MKKSEKTELMIKNKFLSAIGVLNGFAICITAGSHLDHDQEMELIKIAKFMKKHSNIINLF